MAWRFGFELLIRSTVLLAGGAVLLRFAKRQSAAFQHRLLLWVFGVLATLPLLIVVCPDIQLPLWRTAESGRAIVSAYEVSSAAVRDVPRHAVNWPLSIWLIGLVVALTPVVAGVISAMRMRRGARPAGMPALQEALRRVNRKATAKTEILIAEQLPVPLTCGLLHPKILLPPEAESWSSARLEAVLLHELAHVRRRDLAAQMAVHFIAAVWWFQPLVWMLRSRVRAESEYACDAEAVRFGLRPSDYAIELLSIAKMACRDYTLSASVISMARSSDLEARVQAILRKPGQSLRSPGRVASGLVLAMIATAASAFSLRPNPVSNEHGGSTMKRTILSALLTSAGLSAATVGGSISDLTGAAIADVKVLMYNPDTGAKQEFVTAPDGKFSFDGAGAGQYILRLEKPGFTSVFREFDLKADSAMNREFTMANEGGEQVADKILGASGGESKKIQVGGKVAQSNLVTKVQPIYPKAAKEARTQGTVELETTISKDGVPLELRVLRSPSDDLSQSALEAVRQWRYRPTLLNGAPIEIVTDVIVNYTLAP